MCPEPGCNRLISGWQTACDCRQRNGYSIGESAFIAKKLCPVLGCSQLIFDWQDKCLDHKVAEAQGINYSKLTASPSYNTTQQWTPSSFPQFASMSGPTASGFLGASTSSTAYPGAPWSAGGGITTKSTGLVTGSDSLESKAIALGLLGAFILGPKTDSTPGLSFNPQGDPPNTLMPVSLDKHDAPNDLSRHLIFELSSQPLLQHRY